MSYLKQSSQDNRCVPSQPCTLRGADSSSSASNRAGIKEIRQEREPEEWLGGPLP